MVNIMFRSSLIDIFYLAMNLAELQLDLAERVIELCQDSLQGLSVCIDLHGHLVWRPAIAICEGGGDWLGG